MLDKNVIAENRNLKQKIEMLLRTQNVVQKLETFGHLKYFCHV